MFFSLDMSTRLSVCHSNTGSSVATRALIVGPELIQILLRNERREYDCKILLFMSVINHGHKQ